MKIGEHLAKESAFWRLAVIVFLLQLIWLLTGVPMYEIDTNSFIRGGLSWDIYHNPLLNIYIAIVGRMGSLYLLILGQLLIFSLSAAYLVRNVLGRQWTLWHLAAAVLAGLEPLTAFYNSSLLAESFFTSLIMLSLAFLLAWMQSGKRLHAILFGAAMGLCFMAKLSAMIHMPLFGLFLFGFGLPLRKRVMHLGLALLPFAFCYAFVGIGQRIINNGDLYTVEGRVRWDFSSALYDSTTAHDPKFSQYVHPYIYPDGQLVQHRELRRELSYLGYKDCVASYENAGLGENRGINACDSIFGRVAAQIMEKHFWQAEKQFVADNFRFIHELNYIDYRFTPGLHYYHPQQEYQYIDSLMRVHYGFDLSSHEKDIHRIWRSLEFGNVYMPIVWWAWWLALAFALGSYFKSRQSFVALVLGLISAIPLLFHFIYISYRPRFLAPYIIVMLLLLLWEIRALVAMPSPRKAP